MWGDNPFDKSTSGGGFMTGAADSPARGGDKQGKGRRASNVFSCAVKQILDCTEDTLSIEGFEGNVLTIVGLVTKVEATTTKMSTWVDDHTGTIECVNYTGTDEASAGSTPPPVALCEGAYGRIVGVLRKSKDSKYIVIFKASPVTDLNELTCHLLEIIQTEISLKKMRQAEDQKSLRPAGGGLENTFANSMIKNDIGGSGAGQVASAGGGIPGFTKNQNLVRRIISNCQTEEGIHRNEIIAQVKGQVPMKELNDILEFLSNEGHVFSTVDDDHFKVSY